MKKSCRSRPTRGCLLIKVVAVLRDFLLLSFRLMPLLYPVLGPLRLLADRPTGLTSGLAMNER